MARKRKVQVPVESVPAGPVFTHGDCIHAYGFCRPGADGTPIFCRCPHERFLVMCKDPSCPLFERRPEDAPPPEVFDVLSEILHAEGVPKRRVPLFRPGDREPWKWVDADDIPPEGISWDGSPYAGAPVVAPAAAAGPVREGFVWDDVDVLVVPEADASLQGEVKEDGDMKGPEEDWRDSGGEDIPW